MGWQSLVKVVLLICLGEFLHTKYVRATMPAFYRQVKLLPFLHTASPQQQDAIRNQRSLYGSGQQVASYNIASLGASHVPQNGLINLLESTKQQGFPNNAAVAFANPGAKDIIPNMPMSLSLPPFLPLKLGGQTAGTSSVSVATAEDFQDLAQANLRLQSPFDGKRYAPINAMLARPFNKPGVSFLPPPSILTHPPGPLSLVSSSQLLSNWKND
ncbi:uncharacterized protein ACN427_004400 [Glossina fuscipes fuscipes]|nr:hypothetical protein GQX74_004619 [Glossina fuscipes]